MLVHGRRFVTEEHLQQFDSDLEQNIGSKFDKIIKRLGLNGSSRNQNKKSFKNWKEYLKIVECYQCYKLGHYSRD
jgi:hypothetical protein